MADDNSVQISFTASVDDVMDGIGQVRDGLAGLTAPISGLSGSIGRLNDAFGGTLPIDLINQCATGVGTIGTAAQGAAAQVQGIGAQLRIMQISLGEKKTLLDAEVNQFQITQNQKFALLQAETQKEYDLEFALLDKKLELAQQEGQQTSAIQDKIAVLHAKHDADMLRLDEQSIAAQQQMWTSALGTIETAFNSELRGLLAGTTSWSQAFKHILGDVIIKFIETCEQMVVKWAAAELAQTTATTSGAAARAAAEQSAAGSGILANAASAMRAIMTDAAQTFAGVFAFLAPVMGPAAAGPAAAAQASVAAAAIFDVGTDYVVRGGLALIHPGETIIPPARGSGPYTGGGHAAQIHAPVSISVSALDSQSVARFFNDNSKHMLRAINDAVRRGAHLGLHALHP